MLGIGEREALDWPPGRSEADRPLGNRGILPLLTLVFYAARRWGRCPPSAHWGQGFQIPKSDGGTRLAFGMSAAIPSSITFASSSDV